MATYSSKGKKPGQFSEQPSEIAVNPTNGNFVVAFAFNGYGYAQFNNQGQFMFQVTNPVAYYAPFIGISSTGEVYLVQSTGLNKSAPNIVLMYNSSGVSMGPVSYTHLDVYKRQWLNCPGPDPLAPNWERKVKALEEFEAQRLAENEKTSTRLLGVSATYSSLWVAS